MRNIYLMSAALVLMTMSANAQSMKRINKEVTAKTWVETATPQKAAKKIATRAGELEANQRYINYSYDESYVWPSTFPADTQGAISLGTLFYSDAFKKYEGCKIVGARFYVNIPIGASKVGVCHVKVENGTPYVGDILASKEVPSTVAHWNYVWFDEPYKIDTKTFDGLLPYYDFTPSNMSADAGNPIASSGTWAGTCGALAFGDIDGKHDPNTWAWQPIYIGTDGSNLMIQLIIEKEDGNDKMEQWMKRKERSEKRGKKFNERQPRQWIRMRYNATNNLAPNENITLLLNEPLIKVDTSRIHLSLGVDSLWEERPFIVSRDSANMLSYTVYGEWRNGQKYKLEIDSAAFTSIYGNNNIRMEMSFSVPATEAYASLFVTLSNYDNGQAYVQLLKGDKPYRTVKADGNHADFYYISPGKYYLRMFVDQNNNGKWDTGLFAENKQPEPVYYFPSEIELRASWDSEQEWNVRSTPLEKQKPKEITKQRAEKKREIQHRNAERLLKKQKEEQKKQRNKR